MTLSNGIADTELAIHYTLGGDIKGKERNVVCFAKILKPPVNEEMQILVDN